MRMHDDLGGFLAVLSIVLIVGGINILIGGRISPNQSFNLGEYSLYVGWLLLCIGGLLILYLKLGTRSRKSK